jgi:hypothetical protein
MDRRPPRFITLRQGSHRMDRRSEVRGENQKSGETIFLSHTLVLFCLRLRRGSSGWN